MSLFSLSGPNTYTGGTVLNRPARVDVGNSTAFGTGTLTINGGTLTGHSNYDRQQFVILNGNLTNVGATSLYLQR